MPAPSASGVTRLPLARRQDDAGGLERLLPFVYVELHRLALARMRGERAGQILQTTELVHEAYLGRPAVEEAVTAVATSAETGARDCVARLWPLDEISSGGAAVRAGEERPQA